MESINKATRETILAQRQELSEIVVERQYQLYPEIWPAFGKVGREKCVQDINFHLTYLAEAIGTSAPLLFVDYINWVKVLFKGLKFPDEVLPTTLKFIQDVLQQHLSQEMQEVVIEYLDVALHQLPQTSATPPTYLREGSPLQNLAQEYLERLLRGDRQGSSQLVLDAVSRGEKVKDIYLYIFQPVQQEIGRLWQINQLSVAQEHYCTAATQLVMSQLYPYIFATEKIGRSLIAACVSGELHEIGLRMVADFFEMEGWNTYYMGSNTPTESILQMIQEMRPDLLAFSATITYHVNHITGLISRIRNLGMDKKVKILVGGYPFNVASGLWQEIGADACAHDAQEAVVLAEKLL